MERAGLVCFCLLTAAKVFAAPNCELKEIFETPHDFDELEIRERSNFDEEYKLPQPPLQEPPKSFANAQVLLKIGNDNKHANQNVFPFLLNQAPQDYPYPILTPHCFYPSLNPLTHLIQINNLLTQLAKLGVNLEPPIRKTCPPVVPLTQAQKDGIRKEILSEVGRTEFSVQNTHPEILPQVEIPEEVVKASSSNEGVIFVPTQNFGPRPEEPKVTKYLLNYPVGKLEDSLTPVEVDSFCPSCGCNRDLKPGEKRFSYDVDDLNKPIVAVLEQNTTFLHKENSGGGKPEVFGFEILRQANLSNGVPEATSEFTILAGKETTCPHCLQYKDKINALLRELLLIKGGSYKSCPFLAALKESGLQERPDFLSNIVGVPGHVSEDFDVVKQSGCPYCAKYKQELNQG